MEIWDAYDKDLNRIEGKTLVRGEESTFPDDVFHLVCEILVKHKDGTFLLMQRDPQKAYGSLWEASAGGSALKGESPLEAAKRELKEETGIVSNELTEVGRVVSPETHSIYVDFFCETDCDKDSILLQEGETVAYQWAERDELLRREDLVKHSFLRMQLFVKELQIYSFRGIGLREKEEIKDLFTAVFTKEPWNDDWSDEKQLDLYINDLIGQSYSLTYGLYEGEELIGLSMGYIKHWYRGTEYYLDELCIRTDKQGSGAGTFFIRQIEKAIKAIGLKQIFLQTDVSAPAYHFYKKLGFTELEGHVSFAKEI